MKKIILYRHILTQEKDKLISKEEKLLLKQKAFFIRLEKIQVKLNVLNDSIYNTQQKIAGINGHISCMDKEKSNLLICGM